MIFTPFHDGVRKILPGNDRVYLTFDDGPQEGATSQVLDLLHKMNAKPTFFVIVDKVRNHSSLAQEILKAGHSIGNHSKNHRYRSFLGSQEVLKTWISESEEELTQILGQKSIGFRPLAGIVTPPLVRVLRDLKLPMYLWSHRFFDTALGFQPLMAKRSADGIRGGEIILLHDAQKSTRLPDFLKTLEFYLAAIKNKGYSFIQL